MMMGNVDMTPDDGQGWFVGPGTHRSRLPWAGPIGKSTCHTRVGRQGETADRAVAGGKSPCRRRREENPGSDVLSTWPIDMAAHLAAAPSGGPSPEGVSW